MVEGPLLFFIFLIAVIFIIISTSVIKLHPFLSLLIAAFGVGIAVGMPLNMMVDTINQGFGQLMSYIGLVIVFGTIIGTILDKSGGALKIADFILRIFGKKRPALAMSIIGAIVSIPVFCDSGFVILSSLNRAVANRSRVSLATMTIALSSGLYATHTLVPPTPGPIAAAGNIGASDFLGTVIWIGLLTSIPAILIGYWWAIRTGPKIQIVGENQSADLSDTLKNIGNLPSTFKSFGPIILPIVLIGLGSTINFLNVSEEIINLVIFLGDPLIALLLGVIWAFTLIPKYDEKHIGGWIGKGILMAGPILLITGAGSAFGSILKATPITGLINTITAGGNYFGVLLIVIAFVVAAALKISQGSSTAAMVITSSMLAPFVLSMNFNSPIALALIVMAIGGGAMTVSHANDSYFWVVTQFSGLKVSDSYKSFTTATLFQGCAVFATTLLLYIILL